jgi:hypothetical protein
MERALMAHSGFRSRSWSAPATAVALALGCSGAADHGAAPFVAQGKAYCGQFWSALGNRSLRCLGSRSEVDSFFSVTRPCDGISGALDSGTVTFDAAAGRACVDGLVQLPCSVFSETQILARCGPVYAGTAREGEGCRLLLPLELFTTCAPGHYCDLQGERTEICPGVCRRYRKEGEQCRDPGGGGPL